MAEVRFLNYEPASFIIEEDGKKILCRYDRPTMLVMGMDSYAQVGLDGSTPNIFKIREATEQDIKDHTCECNSFEEGIVGV